MSRIIYFRNGWGKELQNSVRNKLTSGNPRKNFHDASLALTALSYKFALTTITFILWIKKDRLFKGKRLKYILSESFPDFLFLKKYCDIYDSKNCQISHVLLCISYFIFIIFVQIYFSRKNLYKKYWTKFFIYVYVRLRWFINDVRAVETYGNIWSLNYICRNVYCLFWAIKYPKKMYIFHSKFLNIYIEFIPCQKIRDPV